MSPDRRCGVTHWHDLPLGEPEQRDDTPKPCPTCGATDVWTAWETGRIFNGAEDVDGLVWHWDGWQPDSRWRPIVWVPTCFARAEADEDANATNELRELDVDWPWAPELRGLELAMSAIQLDRLVEDHIDLIRRETQLRHVASGLAARCHAGAELVSEDVVTMDGLTVNRVIDRSDPALPATGVIVGDWVDILRVLETMA